MPDTVKTQCRCSFKPNHRHRAFCAAEGFCSRYRCVVPWPCEGGGNVKERRRNRARIRRRASRRRSSRTNINLDKCPACHPGSFLPRVLPPKPYHRETYRRSGTKMDILIHCSLRSPYQTVLLKNEPAFSVAPRVFSKTQHFQFQTGTQIQTSEKMQLTQSQDELARQLNVCFVLDMVRIAYFRPSRT